MLRFALIAALTGPQLPPSVDPMGSRPKWVLDYAPKACVLSRARVGTEGGLRLETRPFEVDHKVSLLLPKIRKESFFRPGRLSVPDQRPEYPSYVGVEETDKEQDRLVISTISDAQLAILATQPTLGMTIPGKLDERVAVAGLGKALQALDRCEEDLAKRWGTPRTWTVDPKPLAGPTGLMRSEDYPSSMVAANIQGSARLIVQIDSKGNIQRCRALESTGPITFAEVVCSVYKKRLRFAPARNAAGEAEPSYFILPEIRFVLAG